MGKIALIADIHANYEALEAVLQDIKKYKDIDYILSLGDNVGYGPDPTVVLRTLYSNNICSIEGNHDNAIVDLNEFKASGAHQAAINAIQWTRNQLAQECENDAEFTTIAEQYFNTEPMIQLSDDPCSIFVHGSPGPLECRFDYLIDPEDFFSAAQQMIAANLHISFFAHTHEQGFWEVEDGGVSSFDIEFYTPMTFAKDEIQDRVLFINPGAVGQPRDGNPNAAYAIYEYDDSRYSFTFCRVPYDIDTTVSKIYNIPELDDRLGERLLRGK